MPRARNSTKPRRCPACMLPGGTGLTGACRAFAAQVGVGCQVMTDPEPGSQSSTVPTRNPSCSDPPPINTFSLLDIGLTNAVDYDEGPISLGCRGVLLLRCQLPGTGSSPNPEW